MENELEKMVEVICQYHRYWSEAKISNLPYRKIEKEYNKIVEKKQEEKEMQKKNADVFRRYILYRARGC